MGAAAVIRRDESNVTQSIARSGGVPQPAPQLDAIDRQILAVLHELEFDPCQHRHGGCHERISPVPYYLIYAAAMPLVKPHNGQASEPSSRSNLLARLEGLKTLGFVRAAERNWPEFSFQEMRDGRFISVEATRTDKKRRGGMSKKSRVQVVIRELTYEVRFGLLTDLDKKLQAAGYGDPETNPCRIFESVINEFRHLSWVYANEADMKKWLKSIGMETQPDLPKYGLCYTLTSDGITCARSLDALSIEPRHPIASQGSADIPDEPTNKQLSDLKPSNASPEPKAILDTPHPAEQQLVSQQLSLDEDAQTLHYCGRSCVFRSRSILLFSLLRRLLRNPGRRVGFDKLCLKDEPWDGRRVEDPTIRGAVTRLRSRLRECDLDEIAKAITVITDGGQSYVMFNSSKLDSIEDGDTT